MNTTKISQPKISQMEALTLLKSYPARTDESKIILLEHHNGFSLKASIDLIRLNQAVIDLNSITKY